MVALSVVGLIFFLVITDVGVRYVFKSKNPAPEPTRVIDRHRPADMMFSSNHLWFRLLPSGEVMVGIDELLGNLMSDATGLVLPEAGKMMKPGETCVTIMFGGRSAHYRLPVESVITLTNPKVINDPSSVLVKPYRQWLFTLMPLNAMDNAVFFQGLRHGDRVDKSMKEDIEHAARFLKTQSGVPSDRFDRVPDDNLLIDVPENAVSAFERVFLSI